MMRSAVAILLTLTLLAPASAHMIGGTPNDARAACRDDAYRFCSAVIKDNGKRRACMAAHRSQLSPGCQASIRY